MLNFSFDEMASGKAAKKTAQLFQRAGAPVIEINADPKVRRTAGISYREMNFTHADGQRTTMRVNKTGDVAQVLINGALVPIKNQTDAAKAIGEISGRLESGRAKFQARLVRTKVDLPKGITTAAPKMEQRLTEEVQRLDQLIEQRTVELSELKEKLGPVLDDVGGGTVDVGNDTGWEPEVVAAFELVGSLESSIFDSANLAHAKTTLQIALDVVTNNYPISVSEGRLDQAESELDASKSFREALVMLDSAEVYEPEEGDQISGSGGQMLTFRKGAWYKLVPTDEHGELPPAWSLAKEADFILDSAEVVVLDAARKMNQKDYAFYVVAKGKIESGWEYREDANDQAKENLPENLAGKVYAKSALKKLGLNPDDNGDWLSRADLLDAASTEGSGGLSLEANKIIVDEAGQDDEDDGADDVASDPDAEQSLFDEAYVDGPIASDSNTNDRTIMEDGEVIASVKASIFDSAAQTDALTEILAELSSQEWEQFPANEIFDAMEGAGYSVVDEYGIVWTGEIQSTEGQEVLNLIKDDTDVSEQLTIQWHKGDSGKYQVTAFLS